MSVHQDTLEFAAAADVEDVEQRALDRAHDEGEKMWSPRHYEILREEWLAAYPDVDDVTRDELERAIAEAKRRARRKRR